MQRQIQTYRHFKGGVYWKIGEALHTETEEELVVYACAVSGILFCRPKKMFEEIVDQDGYTGPRFVPLPDDTTKEQRKSLKWKD